MAARAGHFDPAAVAAVVAAGARVAVAQVSLPWAVGLAGTDLRRLDRRLAAALLQVVEHPERYRELNLQPADHSQLPEQLADSDNCGLHRYTLAAFAAPVVAAAYLAAGRSLEPEAQPS